MYADLHRQILTDLHRFYRERARHYAELDLVQAAYVKELDALEAEMDSRRMFYGTR